MPKKQTLLDVLAISRKNLDPMVIGAVRMIDRIDALTTLVENEEVENIHSVEEFLELPVMKTWKDETITLLPSETSQLFIGLLTWSLAPIFSEKT